MIKIILPICIGIAIGFSAARIERENYWKLTEINPPPLRTMTAYTYGPWTMITARPGVRLITSEQMGEVAADEDQWRKPWDLNPPPPKDPVSHNFDDPNSGYLLKMDGEQQSISQEATIRFCIKRDVEGEFGPAGILCTGAYSPYRLRHRTSGISPAEIDAALSDGK